jgi:hypothetical protein
LAGQGRETILLLDPQVTKQRPGVALVNAGTDLHDVTLRDLVIEGGLASSTSRDPNSDRRQRARPTAPSRAGIAFSAQPSGRMHRLRFEHVTVRNCTLDGVAIRGAAQVVIAACDFSDNGCVASPETGPHHNLLLADVTGCQITDSRLDTSPAGSGLDLSQSQDVKVTNTESARNASAGIHVTESRNVQVRGNLAEGNDGDGILFSCLTNDRPAIEIRDNLSRNNGGYGLKVTHAFRGSVQGNTLLDNALPEQMP